MDKEVLIDYLSYIIRTYENRKQSLDDELAKAFCIGKIDLAKDILESLNRD